MSGFDVGAIGAAVMRAKARMTTLEQELNVADSKLGDGDTGVMMARIVDAMAALDYAGGSDVGAMLSQMARKTASATGSSLGTLIATALLTISRRTKGQASLPCAELGGHVAAAVEAMIARGGANLGDKTVLDILHAVAEKIAGLGDAEAASEAAVAAAADTLATFRGRPCRVGRARMFGDKSIGLDDPGMFAVHELLRAVARR
jgi:dihydroxyacetone kinase